MSKLPKLIAPSILSADFANLQKEIEAVTQAGADWIHVDVMDGHFVPNLTIGPPVVKSLKSVSKLPLDCHLMIANPAAYIEDFARAGADTITIHIETTAEPAVLLQKIRALGCKAGVTLKPATPLAQIEPFLHLCDLVLVMTVNPGFSGQSFMVEQVAKIKKLAEARRQNAWTFLIEVDGGVNAQTISQCHEADVFVAGNAVFKAPNYAQAIQELKAKARS